MKVIYIPDEIHKKLKVAAYTDDKSLKDLVTDVLRDWIVRLKKR